MLRQKAREVIEITIKNTNLGGIDFESGTALPAADLNDTFDAIQVAIDAKPEMIIYGPLITPIMLLGHGGTIVSYNKCPGGIYQTTDYQSGDITWTQKNTTVSAANYGSKSAVCKADHTDAICMEAIGEPGDCAYTTDSGVTWSNTSTNPPNCTEIWALSVPTTSLAVAFGEASSGEHIWVSTDGGDNWAQITTDPGGKLACGDMYDGTTGFCIKDGSKDVYITSDSADTWDDTTVDAVNNAGVSTRLFALSATEYLIADNQGIFKGSDSVAPTRKATISSNSTHPSDFLKMNYGNMYILYYESGTSPTSGIVYLYKSTDSGDTWKYRMIAEGYVETQDYAKWSRVLTEAANNILLFPARCGGNNGAAMYTHMIEIDEN